MKVSIMLLETSEIYRSTLPNPLILLLLKQSWYYHREKDFAWFVLLNRYSANNNISNIKYILIIMTYSQNDEELLTILPLNSILLKIVLRIIVS